MRQLADIGGSHGRQRGKCRVMGIFAGLLIEHVALRLAHCGVTEEIQRALNPLDNE